MNKSVLCISMAALAFSIGVQAKSGHATDEVIATQRENLTAITEGKGFGPQSPRDIRYAEGSNNIVFENASPHTEMNLCNIHFHENAEHAGGEFTKFAGNGDGAGFSTGYLYSGELTRSEKKSISPAVCSGKYGDLQSGDTIEIHYVHSSAQVNPGPTLNSCLSESIVNPQLRVEAQVYVLVNDSDALDFNKLTSVTKQDGYHQVQNIPRNTGTPVVYSGSTTGPSYNEAASPLQVTWSVRPEVAKVNIETVGQWCKGNAFDEDHAHGVRNLVTNPDLLSPID